MKVKSLYFVVVVLFTVGTSYMKITDSVYIFLDYFFKISTRLKDVKNMNTSSTYQQIHLLIIYIIFSPAFSKVLKGSIKTIIGSIVVSSYSK